jgi:hypothetical protein
MERVCGVQELQREEEMRKSVRSGSTDRYGEKLLICEDSECEVALPSEEEFKRLTRSHTRTIPSSEVDIKKLPQGEKATVVRALKWACQD